MLTSALLGNTLYVGGFFEYVGPGTGPLVNVNPTTGAVVGSMPFVDGAILAAARDGNGGWYIGGDFQHVAGVSRERLAHIREDGSLDGWNPGPDGEVRALVARDQSIIVGGLFTSIGGQSRSCLAEVDRITGLATSWNPAVTGGIPSVEVLAAKGDTLCVCGFFDGIAGAARSSLAGIDLRTGALTPWNPAPTGIVAHMCLAGSTLYASGNFGSIGGQIRAGLAAIDLETGLVTGWNPMPATYGVLAIAATPATVYVGGTFTQINGQGHLRLAALDAVTGEARPWSPDPSDIVNGLAADGAALYVEGAFRVIAGQSRSCLAAFDVATGNPTAWNPSADVPPQVLVPDGSTVLLAGTFTMMGASHRRGLAAIDLTTGRVSPWDPNADGYTLALTANNGTVYVSGWYSNVGGQPRAGLAALDSISGLATAWNPVPEGGIVNALAAEGSTLYLGGSFTGLSGQPRDHLAAVDAGSGEPLTWSPTANGGISSVVPHGASVYVTGGFTTIGDASRTHVAEISATSGAATPWDPGLQPANWVSSLVAHEGTVYLGGDFSAIGGASRHFLAALDSATGLAGAWYPFPNTSGVGRISCREGTAYVGTFDDFGGAVVGAADAVTGTTSDWSVPVTLRQYNLPFYTWPGLRGLETDDARVYLAGRFDSACSQPRRNLVAVERSSPLPLAAAVVSPEGGETLVMGEPHDLCWSSSAPHGIQSVDLQLSRTGPSGPWDLIAAGLANTGRYTWQVSGDESDGLAYLRVDARDWSGGMVSSQSSAGFSILPGTTAVDDSRNSAGCSLSAPVPNPAPGRTSIAFAIPTSAFVRVSVIDVQGREVAVPANGPHPAGRHTVTLDATRLPPGLYFVRLQTDGADLRRRCVVLR